MAWVMWISCRLDVGTIADSRHPRIIAGLQETACRSAQKGVSARL